MANEMLDLWPETQNKSPRRSRLFSLAPIGTGTLAQESLSSYMVRLARAHSVTPLHLCNRELLPITDIKMGRAMYNFTVQDAKTMNGLNKYAIEACRGFKELTGRTDLESCTLLPWRDVIDKKALALLHPHPRWCPACFIEWRARAHEPYWPLLWFLAPATQCPTHGKLLVDTCPHCSRHQPFIPRHHHMDFCSHCGQSLAFLTEAVNRRREYPHRWLQTFASKAIAEMIASSPEAAAFATHQRLTERLNELIRIIGEGNPAEFHRRLGLREKTTSGWRRDGESPTIESLLLLCFRVNTSPVSLLRDALPDTLAPREKLFPLPRLSKRKNLSKRERDRILQILRETGNEDEASTSLKDVAQQLGFSTSFLRYWWRDECEIIAERHRAFRRQRSETREQNYRSRTAAIAKEILTVVPQTPVNRILARLKEDGIGLSWIKSRAIINAVRQEILLPQQPVRRTKDGLEAD